MFKTHESVENSVENSHTGGRSIRAPHAFDGDPVAGERLLWHAACMASDVARHTGRDADETMVAIMRLVGHICETGEED